MKSNRTKWKGYFERVGEKWDSYRISAGKSEEQELLLRFKRK
jgi:hypothetical protein